MSLPGLMMPPGLMAGGGSKEITLKSSVTYTHLNATWPIPGVAASDIIIVCIFGNDFEIENPTPASFTNLGFAIQAWGSDNRGNTRLAAKIATGAEGGTNIRPAFGGRGCVILVFGFGAASMTPGTPAQTATNADPVAQTILSGSASGPCIAVGTYGSSGSISTNTATPAWDAVISPASTFRVGYKIFNASPVNISFDMGDHGNANRLVGNHITVT